MRPSVGSWLLAGFVSGALAVLIFHQGAIGLMHSAGLVPRAPFSMQPTSPWGIPQIGSITFWGGVWGIVLAAMLHSMDRGKLVLAALVLGAILPTLFAWFVVAPLKGQPMAAGFVPASMAIGPIVNGAWGLGTGIGLWLFRSRFRRPISA